MCGAQGMDPDLIDDGSNEQDGFDDDDEFLPHHLEACARHAAATDADMVFPWFVTDHCSDPFPGEFGAPWDPDHPRQTTTVIFARRHAINDVGGYRFVDGDRHDDGGRKPTVQAGGSPMVKVKSPWVNPVGLLRGRPTACTEAMYGGSSTSNCSSDGR